jgi:O-antigen/teichoic acid export membrane protein
MGRLTQQVVFLTLEKSSHLGGAMILLIAVARLMGEDGLGAYAYMIAITAVFVPALDLGLNTRVIREVASSRGGPAFREAIAFKVRTGAVAVLLMVCCAWAAGKSVDIILAVLLVGLSTWAMSVGDVFNSVFKGLKKAEYSAFLVGSTYLCLTGLAIGSILYGVGLLGIALSYLVCRIGFLGVARALIPGSAYQVGGGFKLKAVSEGIRFMPAVFFVGALLNINFLLADGMGQGAESAVYAIGYRVVAALFVLVSASNEGILPALVEVIDNKSAFRRLFVGCFTAFVGAGLICVALIQVLGYWAVVWIFGADYAGAVSVLGVLCWVLPPLLCCAASHTALLALDKSREGFVWMMCLVFFGAILGTTGFWWAGAWGAALAPAVSGGVLGPVMGWRVWRHLGSTGTESKTS